MSYPPLNTTPTAFHRFPDLPAEIQLKICALVVPEPRSIAYSTRSWDDRISAKGIAFATIYKRTFTVPGILSACIDSRIDALRRYQPAFAVEPGRPTYVDFGRDVFESGDFQALQQAFS